MIRAVLVAIAVLVVVLAVVFDQQWLYGVSAAVLGGVLFDLGRRFWRAYRDEEVDRARPEMTPDDPAEDEMGLVDVRRQDDGEEPEATADEEPSASDQAPKSAAQEAVESTEAQEARVDWEDQVASDGSQEAATANQTASSVYSSEERPVLAPFLESLRASIGAQSVCLLVQEEVALEYRIEAMASVQPDAKHEGTFETQEPLLTATMSRQAVTVRSVGGDERRDLGYYGTVPAVTQVAMAPVSRPETSATVFLMADATSEVDLGGSDARSLIEHFSDTVARLLDAEETRPDHDIQVAPEAEMAEETAAEERSETTDSSASSATPSEPADQEPRPRREIIAEEMEAADAASEELALVLVHLNRAESIARQGEEAVAAAERHLRSRLEDLAPGRRVERFGELTYGIFVRSGVDAVEDWAANLQDSMAQETGKLEGGVSVGVAVRDVRHDAEGLRADATDALLEAYETGTCTIIA